MLVSGPVSIKDIARVAGVSHPTVSRALADSPLVATKTKQRIKQLAEEMGYSPSAIARGLVTKHTLTIGLVVTTVADPFLAELVRGVEETALDLGYSVLLCDCNAEPERELNCVRSLREKRVDGIVVASSRVGNLYMSLLEQLGVPVVLVNNQQDGQYVYSVRTNDPIGGKLAGEYLLSLGHHRIAYIAGPSGAHASQERLEGFREVLRSCGKDIPVEWILPGNGRADGGQSAIRILLGCAELPTAIFCYNDMTAIGALTAIKSAGLRVPDDISLVGYDDIPFASLVEPPLTTVAQAKYALGEGAMRLVLSLLTHQGEVMDTVLTPVLVERESCASPAR